MNDIYSFAENLADNYPDVSECYIAIIEGEDGYDLEVEISDGEIGGTFSTQDDDLENARFLANELHLELESIGLKVYESREEWEESF